MGAQEELQQGKGGVNDMSGCALPPPVFSGYWEHKKELEYCLLHNTLPLMKI